MSPKIAWLRRGIGRTSRLRLGVSAKALAKFWRHIGFRKYFFLFTIIKRRSVAFQPCITLGGAHWVEMGQNNDFLPKSGLKTLILAVMVLHHLTLKWPGTHNFKGIANFHRCFEKFGTSASKWAMYLEGVNLQNCLIGGHLKIFSVWSWKNAKNGCFS